MWGHDNQGQALRFLPETSPGADCFRPHDNLTATCRSFFATSNALLLSSRLRLGHF